MLKETEFIQDIKIGNDIVGQLLKEKNRKSLAIYIYLLKKSKYHAAVSFTFNEFADVCNIQAASVNLKNMNTALQLLIDKELIEVYEDVRLRVPCDISNIVKNKTMYIVVSESEYESSFTLIRFNDIEKLLYADTDESFVDMLSILALICRNIERKEHVLPITWWSINKMADELHMKDERLMDMIKEMMSLRVVYYKLLTLELHNNKFHKSHYVYSLYEDSDFVEQFISDAKLIGRIDKKLKYDYDYKGKNATEIVFSTPGIYRQLEIIKYDTFNNINAVSVLQNLIDKYSEEHLQCALGQIQIELYNSTKIRNHTAFAISKLNEYMLSGKMEKFYDRKVSNDRKFENMEIPNPEERREAKYVTQGSTGLNKIGKTIEELNGEKISPEIQEIKDIFDW